MVGWIMFMFMIITVSLINNLLHMEELQFRHNGIAKRDKVEFWKIVDYYVFEREESRKETKSVVYIYEIVTI